MQLEDHRELIAVLTELWTLFERLAIIRPGASLIRPPSYTGIHPDTSFHADKARAAGFSPTAVAVMSALPYLHDNEPDMGRRAVEIESETFPLSYLHLDEEDHFRDLREIACDPENIMQPSDVRITCQLANGWEYIYNTEKGLVYVWNQINDDHDDYLHLEPIPPRQAFQPLIDNFRGLRRVALPERRFVRNDPARAPERQPHGTVALYEAEIKLWRAMCGLADLYLETGWDVNAVSQTNFRTSDFIHKRTRYTQEVIGPLEDEVYQAREDARKLHEA